MKRRVVVTGIGSVTSLSLKIDDLWQKVLAGKSGIHDLRLFNTTDHKVKFGGDIYDWSTEGYVDLREAKRVDRFTQFALVAGIDAMDDAGIDFSKYDPFRAGAIVGSGSVIVENVSDNALAVGRGRQVEKAGWATAFREQKSAEKAAKK